MYVPPALTLKYFAYVSYDFYEKQWLYLYTALTG